MDELIKFYNEYKAFIQFESDEIIEFCIKGNSRDLEIFPEEHTVFTEQSFIELLCYELDNDSAELRNTDLSNLLNELRRISGNEEHFDIRIKVKINKKSICANLFDSLKELNIYFFSSISRFIDNFDFLKISNKKNKLNILILENLDYTITERYLNIFSLDKFEEFSNCEKSLKKLDYENLLKMEEMFTYVDEVSYLKLPDIWKNVNIDNSIVLRKVIANFFDLVSNKKTGELKFKIKGLQVIELNFSDFHLFPEISAKDLNKLIDKVSKIIGFLLDDQNRFFDKLLITRNILTTYLHNDSSVNFFLEKIDSILSSIEHAIELYIQNKVQIFLDQQNKLIQEAMNVAKETSKLTNEMINLLRTTCLSLVGTVFISLLTTFRGGFNAPVINLSLISYCFYFIGVFYISFGVSKQAKLNLINFEEYMTEMSKGNIDGLNYKDLKKKFIKKNSEEFNKMKFTLWILILILFLIFLLTYIALRFNLDFLFIKRSIKFLLGI